GPTPAGRAAGRPVAGAAAGSQPPPAGGAPPWVDRHPRSAADPGPTGGGHAAGAADAGGEGGPGAAGTPVRDFPPTTLLPRPRAIYNTTSADPPLGGAEIFVLPWGQYGVGTRAIPSPEDCHHVRPPCRPVSLPGLDDRAVEGPAGARPGAAARPTGVPGA